MYVEYPAKQILRKHIKTEILIAKNTLNELCVYVF